MNPSRRKIELDPYVPREVVARLRGLELSPRKLVEGRNAGRFRSPRHGNALEFSGHRPYSPGDDARRFDWNLYCRTRRWYVRQYHLEASYTAHVLLDAGRSMLYPRPPEGAWREVDAAGPSKLLYAARMAIVLGYLITRHNDMVGLGICREGWDPGLDARPNNSLSQPLRFIQVLEHVEARGKTDLGKSILRYLRRTDRHAILFVISDCAGVMNSLSAALQRARASDHEVVLFHLLHPDELRFPFEGPVRFEDYAGLDGLSVHAQDVRERFGALLDEHCNTLRRTAERNGAEYVRVDTSKEIDQVLLEFLARRRASTA